jgi:type IV pilus assembly protein PilB
MLQCERLGERLVNAELISLQRLQTALHLQKQKGGFLGQILVEEGWITEQQLCQALSKMLDVRWGNIDCLRISQDVLKFVSKSMAMVCKVLPLFVRNNTIYLAMEDPSDTSVIQFIELKSRMQVKPLLAPVQQLLRMIRKYYYYAESAHESHESHE